MTAALLALLPASALLYLPLAYEEFEQPKVFALITFACFAAFWVNWRHVLKDKIALALSVFTLSAAISTVLSIDWHMSIFGNVKCRAGLLVFASYLVLYLAMKDHLKNKDNAIDLVIATSIVVSVYAILQVMGIDFKQWNGMLKEINYTRPMSFLGHPNFMAGYLAMVLPFAFHRFKSQKILCAIAVPLSIAVIFLSLSRGMILACAVSLVFYFYKSKIVKRSAIVLLPASIVFALIPSFRETAIHRLKAMFAPGPARIEYPMAAIRIWRRWPVFGVGTDAFELAFQQQRTDYYWQIERGGSPHKAHNDFLNTLATQGMVGAIAALWLTFQVTLLCIKSKSQYLLPATASIIAFYVEGLTSFTVVATGTMFILCLSLLSE